MHVVNPQAFIIGQTSMHHDGARAFLDAVGAVDWHWHDSAAWDEGELLVEIAGRTCYKSFGTELNKNLTRVRSGNHDYIGNILKTKHGSVLEHSTVTVGFVNVSRVFTHELVRHRAGCAYSQESMRFVRLEDVGMYVPECIKSASAMAQAMFENAVGDAERAYQNLTHALITDDMPFSKKKEITSAIRRIAPSGHATNVVVTANHRAWRHLFELRTAPGVEEEMGVVMSALGKEFKDRYPAMYQDMTICEHAEQVWETLTFENSKI